MPPYKFRETKNIIFNPLFLHNLFFDEAAMDTNAIKEEKSLAISTAEKVLEVDDIPEYANNKAFAIIGGILTRERGFISKDGNHQWFDLILKASKFENFERVKNKMSWDKTYTTLK